MKNEGKVSAKRCDHGFLRGTERGCVRCPICDHDARPEDAVAGQAVITKAGAVVAGVLILKIRDRDTAVVQCGCGETYRTLRSTLTKSHRQGRTCLCPTCRVKLRSQLIREGMAKASAA